ncbi:DUF3581 domain-containing protein [Aquisalimonas sp. 2447]|uniref:DUF3581 family protein n=1 Tax=Aquisalimonas sp. 2447 TaxID=2740807 RepID=UPI00143265CD|nr:DUF3581 family protein [Aquisalimonas sp. 2447]QIT57356.1 DUF3581 domain-containing protein [Aquisalimonas sp. 2447]
MFLNAYHSFDGSVVRISAEQASRFAKEVAGDFNPIHDAEARRFCVPGDLLFALVVGYYGLSERMTFRFRGMVGRDVPLHFPDTDADAFTVTDDQGRAYLEVERAGAGLREAATAEAFVRRYTAFSGRNFPEFLEPLMRNAGMMFNPQRPLVLYDSMAFTLEATPTPGLDMDLDDSTLNVDGKRGEEWLRFRITDGGEAIGAGWKKVVISGLQPWDEEQMSAFIDAYTARRASFRTTD